MAKVEQLLKEGKPLKDCEFSTPEVDLINAKLGSLLTTKPMIYLVNLTKEDYCRKRNNKQYIGKVRKWIEAHGGGEVIIFSVEFEEEWAALKGNKEAQLQLSQDNGGAVSAIPQMVRSGYAALSLIHYFTCGEKEVKCWTCISGALAPQAASAIHGDFERLFIKAEVVSFLDFKELQKTKGLAEVKAAGKVRVEGKRYVVQDGDIVHFQIGKG
jgi:obg-like ATPase 1